MSENEDWKYKYYPELKSGAWFREGDKNNFMTPTHIHSDGTQGFDVWENGEKEHFRFPK